MRHIRLAPFVFLFLASAGFAAAQVTIGNVVNAGSRLPATSPFYGIGQGALFSITGKGLGPDPLQQATFPLPTTAGLAGVTVQASVGGATVDCIMVYVSSTDVGAILPSATPLGTGTVTLNNNGVTASKAITVVAAAFGIFTQTPTTGAAQALAFNVNSDGSMTLNGPAQSVQPEQNIIINGTGLGAITSDETQSGVTDIPNTTIQVFVGVVPATVVSAGRGLCCAGLDPSYPIPQGMAAWDVISIAIPDGITGCNIPLVVQVGNLVSNLATISIDPSGAACTQIPSTLPPALAQQLANTAGISIGAIDLGRSIGTSLTAAGAVATNKRDTGSAVFTKIANLPPGDTIAADTIYPVNVCTINGYPDPNGNITHNGATVVPMPIQETGLDAGPAVTIKGPSGTRTITRQTAGMLVDYRSANLGDTTPGNFLDPGHYTATGTGGKDVGAFTASTDVPATPFVWTNMPSLTTPLDRSKGLTVTWTGGIPGTQVTALGASGAMAFLCAASVSAGQLTIPSYVLLTLPLTGSSTVPGSLGVQNRLVTLTTMPGIDLASIAYSTGYNLNLKLQ